jgi:DNA processing protein
VLLVEARARSGALVTARLALAMGRPLLAVPGSPGTDGLLAAGKAREVADASALTAALSGAPSAARIVPSAFASLVTALAEGAAPAPELARRMGLGLSPALALISEAELGGWIRRGPGGTFVAALTKDIRGN